MFERLTSGPQMLAIAIIFATLVGAWMFRFETTHPLAHRNRFTGAWCDIQVECWFTRVKT
jgi:hypothetical protein